MPDFGKMETQESIQYACHTKNKNTNRITFMAIDPFTTYEFFLDPQQDNYRYVNAYVGNSENQLGLVQEILDSNRNSTYKH